MLLSQMGILSKERKQKDVLCEDNFLVRRTGTTASLGELTFQVLPLGS